MRSAGTPETLGRLHHRAHEWLERTPAKSKRRRLLRLLDLLVRKVHADLPGTRTEDLCAAVGQVWLSSETAGA
eukprot:2048661-Amphidinium_carterae.1